MKFLSDLWTLLLNAWLNRDLKEVDQNAIKPPKEEIRPTDDEIIKMTPPVAVVLPKPTEPEKDPIVEDPPTAPIKPVEPAGVGVDAVVASDHMQDFRVFTPEPKPEDYGAATPLVNALEELGHMVFKNGERPYNLNIVGERNTRTAKMDKWGCRIHVFWKWKGQWILRSWPITTYPGSRYLVEKLLNPRGGAILKEGQYRNTYAMSLHGGRYRALCQRLASVLVYRDGDRDREFDMKPSSVMSGMFGINIHAPITVRAGMKTYVASKVYAASAGCQVFQRLQDFLEFRTLCDNAEKEWGNKFTYTLIRDTDVDWEST